MDVPSRVRAVVLAEEERTRVLLRRALESSGAVVSTASSGIELLELLGDNDPADVVIAIEAASHLGPTPTGVQVLASTRAFGDSTPFIIVDEDDLVDQRAFALIPNAAVVGSVEDALSTMDRLIEQDELRPSKNALPISFSRSVSSSAVVARPHDLTTHRLVD